MSFYRFKNMTIDKAEEIAAKLGLQMGDLYEQLLVTTNGGRFEFEDEHSISVKYIDVKIWIDVLYGDTKNYRSNVFYWNKKYGSQIPENAIIIGDTQNNGFIVYIYSGIEKGVYYWDDSYTLDCSNKDCNAYLIAEDIKSLFQNANIKFKQLFGRKIKCKPNEEFGKDNMLYRAPDSKKIMTMDAGECKKITHKCKKFKVKYEFTRQYYPEYVTRQEIKKIEEDTGYIFADDLKNFIVNVVTKKFKYVMLDNYYVDNNCLIVLRFDNETFLDNAWYINCSGYDVKRVLEKGDTQYADALREFHKNYIVFAYDKSNEIAVDKRNNNIVLLNKQDLTIKKRFDDFESFMDGYVDKIEKSA